MVVTRVKIQVWDNGGITMDRYTVLINKHEFLMSYYPNRANEVNQYLREVYCIPIATMNLTTDKNKLLPKIPKNIRYAVRQRCKELRNSVAPTGATRES